jgi:hypothetical protein
MLRPTASRPVYLGTKPHLEPKTIFLLPSDTYGVCSCGAPSLMRGWICRLKLLLALASAVILGSESHGTHDHILLSQIQDPEPGGPGPVFISPGNIVSQLYPPALGSLFVASYDS